MFLTNKYTNTYYNIINANGPRGLATEYTERHHIIPKSLGGSNSKDNLVLLTGREHFICHMLLIRMTTGVEKFRMVFAARMMLSSSKNHRGRYTPSSRTYQLLKEMAAKASSILQTGTTQSPESNKKRSDTLLGKKRGSPSLDTRTRMSLAKKDKPSGRRGGSLSTRGKSYEEIYGPAIAAVLKEKRSIAWTKREVSASTRKLQSRNRTGKNTGSDSINAKSVLFNNILYPTIDEAILESGLSRYKFNKIHRGVVDKPRKKKVKS